MQAYDMSNYILTDFMCFDLSRWRKAFRLPAEQRDLAIQNLTRQYVRLCQTLGLPVHQQSEARVRKELRPAARCLLTGNPEAVAKVLGTHSLVVSGVISQCVVLVTYARPVIPRIRIPNMMS